MRFVVEDRYFQTAPQAFAFAQDQAEATGRSVEVCERTMNTSHKWFATAYPPGFRRVEKQPPRKSVAPPKEACG